MVPLISHGLAFNPFIKLFLFFLYHLNTLQTRDADPLRAKFPLEFIVFRLGLVSHVCIFEEVNWRKLLFLTEALTVVPICWWYK